MRKVVLQKLRKPKYQRLHGKAWDRISIVCCRQRSPLLWPMLKQSTDFRAKLNPGESSANWSRCWKQGVKLIVYYNVGRSNIHESGLEFGCKYKSVFISRHIKLCQLKTQRGNWKFVGKKVGIKDAPFWNVLFPNGHCPNSFWPPPLPNRHRRALFSDPISNQCNAPSIFWHCRIELKRAQTIPASLLTHLKQEITRLDMEQKVLQTILASAYTPPPLTCNAHMETTYFKKGLP